MVKMRAGQEISLVGRAVLNAQSPEGAAEIVAYQAAKQWIYAINSFKMPRWWILSQQQALIAPPW